MNKNVTALILIVLAIGVYFTYTKSQLEVLKGIRAENAEYQVAINNSHELVKVRDTILQSYNKITETDRDRLNKIVPDTVDNIRLIIDVKDNIAAKHNLILKNIKTASPDAAPTARESSSPSSPSSPSVSEVTTSTGEKFGVATLSFSVSTTYEKFVDFLKEMETSLRIMDVSKLTIAPNDKGGFEFGVELKTYWLKQ